MTQSAILALRLDLALRSAPAPHADFFPWIRTRTTAGVGVAGRECGRGDRPVDSRAYRGGPLPSVTVVVWLVPNWST